MLSKVTRKEVIDFCEMQMQLEPENEDIFNYIIEVLEREPFLNKPCVSKGVCHEDKVKALDKIRNEVKALTDGAEPDHVWNVDVFAIIDKYKAEEE